MAYGAGVADSYLLPSQPIRTFTDLCAWRGCDSVERSKGIAPSGLRDLFDSAGLRSRDQVAQRLGNSWSAFAASPEETGTRYLLVDATDSEPGSFVDRTLLERNPLAILEGTAIAARSLGVAESFIVVDREATSEYELITDALAAAEMAGWCEDVSIKCIRVDQSYLLRDPRALLEAAEGREALPRLYPALLDGLFSVPDRQPHELNSLPLVANPTLVETAETMANLGAIVANGASWFRSRGTAISPGSILCTISGDVTVATVAEVELGEKLSTVIERHSHGTIGGQPKAVLSGASSQVLTRSRLNAPLSWEGLAAVGANLGRAAFLVFGESTNMVTVARDVAAFLYVESCALCPACKFGGGEVTAYLSKLTSPDGTREDAERLLTRLTSVADNRRCDLAAQLQEVITSILRAFPGDLALAPAISPPTEWPLLFGRLATLDNGLASIDQKQRYKSPDGSYHSEPVQLTRWR